MHQSSISTPSRWSGSIRRNQIPDPKLFGLKTTPYQDGANKEKFSQIGPAIPEEIGHKQTNILLLYMKDILINREVWDCVSTERLNISQNKNTHTPYFGIFYLFAWKTHLHISNRVAIKWLIVYLYVYIEKFEVTWEPNSSKYRKTKKHVYPIFGFSIFLSERPTSVSSTGWP